jgi:hypothetical protein
MSPCLHDGHLNREASAELLPGLPSWLSIGSPDDRGISLCGDAVFFIGWERFENR